MHTVVEVYPQFKKYWDKQTQHVSIRAADTIIDYWHELIEDNPEKITEFTELIERPFSEVKEIVEGADRETKYRSLEAWLLQALGKLVDTAISTGAPIDTNKLEILFTFPDDIGMDIDDNHNFWEEVDEDAEDYFLLDPKSPKWEEWEV